MRGSVTVLSQELRPVEVETQAEVFEAFSTLVQATWSECNELSKQP
jgi:hypothetical protein